MHIAVSDNELDGAGLTMVREELDSIAGFDEEDDGPAQHGSAKNTPSRTEVQLVVPTLCVYIRTMLFWTRPTRPS